MRALKAHGLFSIERMNALVKIVTFFKEVRLETKRVNWPTQKEVTQNTIIVIIVSLMIATFLGIVDFVFTTFLNRVIF